ncbi:hypothetical protein OsJ_01772 [Oryza sativa Japonica Group]|uniref:Uncharacterized protein n=1 Tax=Oryza sativa subsp. japonica TaxID=39947 RepID=B9EWR5_ORYSJ|nr:hypothetical protein OsJ_01772 [Oryza sativa Japonica Group]
MSQVEMMVVDGLSFHVVLGEIAGCRSSHRIVSPKIAIHQLSWAAGKAAPSPADHRIVGIFFLGGLPGSQGEVLYELLRGMGGQKVAQAEDLRQGGATAAVAGGGRADATVFTWASEREEIDWEMNSLKKQASAARWPA